MKTGGFIHCGRKITLLDLQAQYLAGQFPFINGEGALLDTLKPVETMVVLQINFADPGIPEIGTACR